MTIVHIEKNDKRSNFHIDGLFQGTIVLKKGAEVTIEKGSKIEAFTSTTQGEVKIKYPDLQMAEFSSDAVVYQDSNREYSGKKGDKNMILLRGNGAKKEFSTSIINATLLEQFKFIAVDDVVLKVHENCNIVIKGAFYSKKPVRLFNVKELSGNISEVEILADTFKQDFTQTKVPGKNGYNTFSIGFKKQAINVIANLMDARNYLYLWIYAHHKVIYYANFLIPILAKELFPNQTTGEFPNWSLDFNNIKYLDDAYIWTVIKYKSATEDWKSSTKNMELKVLLKELFTRKYKKSLYKSLAEYDLFFEKYDRNTKKKLQDYINVHLINTVRNARPYIETNSKDGKSVYSVGYFKKTEIKKINDKIKENIDKLFPDKEKILAEYENLELVELVYVSANYKRKQLETLKTYIDMGDDIIPISQIPLLESQIKKGEDNVTNTYFYLYYQTKYTINKGGKESDIIKDSVKNYFDELVESI